MPIPSPFHQRTSECCTSLLWKEWAGYYAVRSYDTYTEREYYAFRHTAGMIDVSPLFKYEVHGADAAEFLAGIMVRNIRKMKVGQVFYTCWCDHDGKVIDDGTVSRMNDTHFRVTAAEPNFAWFQRFSRGFDVTLRDSTQEIGALSIQGPNSREILKRASDADMDSLKYFRVMAAKVGNLDVSISRTGYTGDLGYEVWVQKEKALPLWDALMESGKDYGLLPSGLDAMDITRVEAGYILNGIDYYSANHSIIESRKSTPYELGLGWMVRLKRPAFNGSVALKKEKQRGPERVLVGLELDWDEYEAYYTAHGLPTEIPTAAWRTSVPIYNDAGEQVGYATSGSWSPILKKNLALATVRSKYEAIGTKLQFEVTVEYERLTVTATVVEKPFYDPARKRE